MPWFSVLAVFALQAAFGGNGEKGRLKTAVNDETFIVETKWGNQIFKAKTFCFGVKEGEEVVFVKSTAACVSNTFVGMSSAKTCDVWCE